jgi:hypothetical protein
MRYRRTTTSRFIFFAVALGTALLHQEPSRDGHFRSDITRFAGNHRFVEARMTHNNGVTNTALVCLRTDAKGQLKVFAVFIDEHFEE